MQQGIGLFGLGGAGCQIGHRLRSSLPPAWPVLLADTGHWTSNGKAFVPGMLSRPESQDIIVFGTSICQGKGCGGAIELGHRAFFADQKNFQALLTQHALRLVFVVVGLGGGAGSGAAPGLCKLIQRHGAASVLLATFPFTFEGRRRRMAAEKTLEQAAPFADVLCVFLNDRIVSSKADTGNNRDQGMREAMRAMDHALLDTIIQIANTADGSVTLDQLEDSLKKSALLGSWQLSQRLRNKATKPPRCRP